MKNERISLNCRGRSPSDILNDLNREVPKISDDHRVILLLNQVRNLKGPLPGLLSGLVDIFHDRRQRASIIDPSGLAGEAYSKLGGSLLVEVCRKESEAMSPREILLVEDSEDNLQFMRALLTEVGHRVTCARTGREAVELHQKSKFDVVLLDLVLPDIDGIAVAGHLAETGVPVIAISAHLDQWGPLDFRRAGFKRILPKPFQIPDLLSALRLA